MLSLLEVVQWFRICLPMQETQDLWVRSLGQEDPLKEEMATHSGILAWKIPETQVGWSALLSSVWCFYLWAQSCYSYPCSQRLGQRKKEDKSEWFVKN